MRPYLIAAALLAGLFLMSTKTDKAGLPRGIRNNNPGNIRHGADWQGRSLVQSDKSFISFDSPEFGIRAMAKIIINYDRLYGINTVRGIINRWAPPSENNTAAYVFAVAASLGVHPDAPLQLHEHLTGLITAIIHHENGSQPYAAATIAAGVALV